MEADREVLPVEHTPLAPPRKGHEGEHIYLRLWQEWAGAEANADALCRIFNNTPYRGDLPQRLWSVAASFMVWQGTNAGYSLRYEAHKIAEGTSLSWEDACLAALAIDNRRQSFVNGGVRVAEVALAPVHPFVDSFGRREVDWKLVPTVTLEDMDVIECLFIWLMCEPAGRALVGKATALIDHERNQRRRAPGVGGLDHQVKAPTGTDGGT